MLKSAWEGYNNVCKLLRSESSSGQERETHFEYSDSGLFDFFTFKLFSFMSEFANRIFAVWLHSEKGECFQTLFP